MILPVSSLQAKSITKQNSEQKNKISYMSQSNNSNQVLDKFNKSQPKVAFKGKSYGGVEYSDEEIADAKRYMHETGPAWKKQLKQLKIQRLKDETPTGVRVIFGLMTGGASEFIMRTSEWPEKADEHINHVSNLIPHLHEEDRQKLRANETRQAELAATRRRLAREAEKAEEANKKNELKTELCDKLNLERNGSHIEKMPNTIMIEDPYDDVSKELVDYAKRNSQSRFIRLDSSDNDTLMDNLDETLRKSKSHFDSTKERTLIHVEGFDRLITKGKNSFENIESLKDVMCRTAKDFGSTIIFRTKDASKLVSEAIGSQRVPVKILTHFRSVR